MFFNAKPLYAVHPGFEPMPSGFKTEDLSIHRSNSDLALRRLMKRL